MWARGATKWPRQRPQGSALASRWYGLEHCRRSRASTAGHPRNMWRLCSFPPIFHLFGSYQYQSKAISLLYLSPVPGIRCSNHRRILPSGALMPHSPPPPQQPYRCSRLQRCISTTPTPTPTTTTTTLPSSCWPPSAAKDHKIQPFSLKPLPSSAHHTSC